MPIVKLALVHLGWLGSGWLILEIIVRGRRRSARRLLEGYFTGIAVHVVALYAWVAVAPLPMAAIRCLIAAGIAAGVVGLALHLRAPVAATGGGVDRPTTPRVSIVDLALAAQLAPPLALIILSGWCVALHQWDPLAIWSTKAGLLYHGEYLRSDAFADPDRVNAHHGYPIGYSLLLLEHTGAAGAPDELMMNRGLIVVVLAGLGLLGLLMAGWAGRRMAMAGLGLLVWTPALWRPELGGAASSGYADLPLGLCAALAAGLILRGVAATDSGSLTAGSACLVLAASFKNEGSILVVLICALGLATVAILPGRRPIREWLALTFPLVALVLLRLAHAHLPTSSDVSFPSIADIAALLALAPRLSTALYDNLLANPVWGMLSLFLPVAVAVGLVRARRQPLTLLALIVPLYLGIICVVLGLTEIQLGAMEKYARTMFPRLIIQLLPSAVLFAVVLNSSVFTQLDVACSGESPPHSR